MIQSGKFNIEEINFKLSMPYPESQTNPELISSQRDLFSMANEILDGIKERMSGGEEINLPTDMIRDVYKKVTSFDPSTVDSWLDKFVAERERVEKEAQAQQEGEAEDEANSQPDFTFESVKRKTGAKFIENIIDEEIIKSFNTKVTEHAIGGKHWYSSKKQSSDFDINLFENIQVDGKIKLLNEEMKADDDYQKARQNFKSNKSNERKEFMKSLREDEDIQYPKEE